MKKVLLTSVVSLFSAMVLNAGDCIMAKDLKVGFMNDSTNYETYLEKQKIEEYAKFLKESDLYTVIEGHTNHYAPAKYNYELSVKRAEKVKNELISLGVEPNKIRALGFGESEPLYSKNDTEGVEKNRRVVAEIFNSEEELNRYVKTAQTNIAAKKFIEQ